MAGKQTPRQRMISMMYLVLTALLALNVSKDVINAFLTVNETVSETNLNLSQKLADTYSSFEKIYLFNQPKVKPFWEKAKFARKLSDEMVQYIDSVKYEVISITEGIPYDSAKVTNVSDIKKIDNFDAPTAYFIGNHYNNYEGKAQEIKKRLDNYRHEMKKIIDLESDSAITLGINTTGPYTNADGKPESWEYHFFYHTILIADITILNKIISDIHNAEFDVVNLLHKSIGQGDFKFDKIEAKIIPESRLVFNGDQYKAQIIVAAYDTTQSPDVYVMENADKMQLADSSKATLINDDSGIVTIEIPAKGVGLKDFAGIVRAKTGFGTIQDYHFNGEFTVVDPSYSISPKKMNVFYAGVDNPVSIDISGVLRKNIQPRISQGSIEPDPNSNDWIVRVPSGSNEVSIRINALINDEPRNMGVKMFRVKNIPDPVATIANKNSGIINRDILLAAGALSPRMPVDFDFDHSFVISSFTMTIQRGFKVYNLKSENMYLTQEMIDNIKKTNRGQSIVFEDIVVKDPTGEERNISPIVLTIN